MIQDELLKLGHRVGAPTIRWVLKRLRIPSVRTQASGTSWRQFLRAPASTMRAMSFMWTAR
ncbi:hypothetical protein JOF56_010003 [Kibdelosporangium banguiense]|uniref:Uncharacterized protein n=1 Tax=Kibdelosporangium banguiense TaxID=1365924 RepID=A0ABS4U052_9PSEU|nr:hypothetical protein [Kibdelosporangium banguiense]